MNPEELRDYVKTLADKEGFDACGVAPALPIGRGEYVRNWLNSGQAGSMAYMHRYFDKRIDPRNLLPDAKSIVVVALIYHQKAHPEPGEGKIAQYAWGDDYHEVLKQKLHRISDAMHQKIDGEFRTKACVDTAPMLEREVASLAGIGWIGKNTMVLRQDLGSFFFLGSLVTTLTIAPDEPVLDHCGTCTACIDACPTDAFPEPYKMDATRCISYLTIEHRGDITRAFQEQMGHWLFGCDDCQSVCPYNRTSPTTRESRFQLRPHGSSFPLEQIRNWSLEEYRSVLKGTAVKRATLPMLKRNAGIIAANRSPDRD